MLLVVGGMIGLGKTSVAEILGRHFNSEVFYESVDDNPILPLFYTATDEEIEKYRYPFLLQLHVLNVLNVLLEMIIMYLIVVYMKIGILLK